MAEFGGAAFTGDLGMAAGVDDGLANGLLNARATALEDFLHGDAVYGHSDDDADDDTSSETRGGRGGNVQVRWAVGSLCSDAFLP